MEGEGGRREEERGSRKGAKERGVEGREGVERAREKGKRREENREGWMKEVVISHNVPL